MTTTTSRASGLAISVPALVITDGLATGTAAVVALALVLGGGTAQGFWSDAIIEVASLPLLLVAGWTIPQRQWSGGTRLALGLVALVLALPLLQLVPLPPALWASLPGRTMPLTAYHTIGMPTPWLPLSLTPAATWRSWLSLLPATAVFLAALGLETSARWRLVAVVLAVALVSIVLDILQKLGGENSPLYFYAITNRGTSVGFFANRNHNAAFLYVIIVLAAAWGLHLSADRHPLGRFGYAAVAALLGGAVIGLAGASSRAGLALGFAAALSTIALGAMHQGGRLRRRWLTIGIAGNLLALLVAFQFGFVGVAQKIETSSVLEDLRWPIAAVTLRATSHNLPLGTGFGSFVPVFRSAEPRSILTSEYVNHAHDDWLELALDGGLPAALIALAFLAWYGGAAYEAWRAPASEAEGELLARAASVIILLLLLHSIVDYPLRTTALSTLVALCAAFLLPPTIETRSRSRRRHGAALASQFEVEAASSDL